VSLTIEDEILENTRVFYQLKKTDMKQSTLTIEQNVKTLSLLMAIGLCAAPFLALVSIIVESFC